MPLAQFARVAGPTFALAASMVAFVTWAADLPGAQDTSRILEAIEKSRPTRTAADVRAAQQLNLDGDRDYKNHRYNAAFMAYANSYPNNPNSYAYIMAGDSHWRAIVRYHERQTTSKGNCTLDNSHFVHDLAGDLAQHYEVGFALAQRDNDRTFSQSNLYARAHESSVCLKEMAQQYLDKPASDCVDVAQLRGCLGAPLVK
jgi:hypothetical protein